MPGFHHIEIWVANLAAAREEWGWLLTELGFVRERVWSEGESWSAGGPYLTITSSPNLSREIHDRRAPGINHLAFNAGLASHVDNIMDMADNYGWSALYQDRYPRAGGPQHYAGWIENSAGFKVEIVANEES